MSAIGDQRQGAGVILQWPSAPALGSSAFERCRRLLAQSAKLLIENKIQEFGVGSQFRVLYDRIETPGNGLIIFQGMQDQNAESIKSLEAYNIAWVEEAQTLSARSLALLRPTIRAEGSEIWFSWNLRRKSDR
jgi:phage terminase large subunit